METIMKSRCFLAALAVTNFFLLLILLGELSSSSADDQKILRTHGLELVDENGQIRSSLKIEPDGEIILRFFDEKGIIRFKAGTSEKGGFE